MAHDISGRHPALPYRVSLPHFLAFSAGIFSFRIYQPLTHFHAELVREIGSKFLERKKSPRRRRRRRNAHGPLAVCVSGGLSVPGGYWQGNALNRYQYGTAIALFSYILSLSTSSLPFLHFPSSLPFSPLLLLLPSSLFPFHLLFFLFFPLPFSSCSSPPPPPILLPLFPS